MSAHEWVYWERNVTRIVAVLLIASTVMTAACKPRVKERVYRSVAVTAIRIDVESGVVVVDWKNAPAGEAKQRTGRVTYETEIFINGISAGLGDVKVGDHAIVTVYASLDNPSEWIVTTVSIEREESFMLNKPLPEVSPSTDPQQSNN